MASKTADCKDGKCPVPDQAKKDKLVASTELPLTGNPYPPRDVVELEKPGIIETKVASLRTMLQPIFSPIHSAYEQTSDFVAIGVAHSQNAVERLAANQNTVLNTLIISSSGLLGIALARRRGFFKKILFGSAFFGGAAVLCYPKDAQEKAQLTWYIAKNKLPELAKQQYEKLTKSNPTPEIQPTEKQSEKKES